MISRRSFLTALAGLAAAPSLIERIRDVPRVWRLKKVMGEIAISGEVLRKLEAGEGAFNREASRILAEVEREHDIYGGGVYGFDSYLPRPSSPVYRA